MTYHSKDVKILMEALAYTVRTSKDNNARARCLTALKLFAETVSEYCEDHTYVGKICFFCGSKKDG